MDVEKIILNGTTYDVTEQIKEDLAEMKYGGGGLTDEARYALLECLSKVAWIDDEGQYYYDALEDALFPVAKVTSITAVYTQSGNVYFDTPLNDLKTDLVVTAHYDDLSSKTVTLYNLSGELTAGTSIVTVSYGGKTTTFNVTVKGIPSTYQMYDYIESPTNENFPQTALIKLKKYDNLNALSCDFWYKAESTHTNNGAIFGGRTESGFTNSYGFYASSNALSYHLHGVSAGGITSANDLVHHVVYTNPTQSPSTLSSDNNTASITWTNNNVINVQPTILTNKFDDSSDHGVGKDIQCGRIRFYTHDGSRVGDYIPCVRIADSVLGMYDIIDGVFYTASDSASCIVGGANVKYSIGNWY